jgi:Mrp family chromosome partitioning ATPase
MRSGSNVKENLLDEQLDTLCLRIEDFLAKQSLMLMVTSPSKEESRLTITCELAKALAVRGKKVLLVDANFNSRSSHRWFQSLPSSGLVDLLLNGNTAQLYRESPVKGLTIIPAGSDNRIAGKSLANEYMEEFNNWKMTYDIILFQVPPAHVSSPLSAITKACDGVIFLVKGHFDKKKDIKKLSEVYQKIGKPVTGVIYQHQIKKFSKR